MEDRFVLQGKEQFAEYRKLICHIAAGYAGQYTETEELISEGFCGLLKALNSYDPSREVKLSTYLYRCITNEINMYLRKELQFRKYHIFGYEELSETEKIPAAAEYEPFDTEELAGFLREAWEELEEHERRFIDLRYGLTDGRGRTQTETAELLGYSQSYISKYEKTVLRKLRTYINTAINGRYS